jgi:hypothetical protein
VVFVDGQILAEPGSGKNLVQLSGERNQTKKVKTPQNLPLEIKRSPIQTHQARQRCKEFCKFSFENSNLFFFYE